MVKGFGAPLVDTEVLLLVPLDDLELFRVIGDHSPENALLGADAAIAGRCLCDLGDCHGVDEVAAMAIAAVGLGGRCCVVGHDGGWWDK